jgi:hypothetical protein
VVIRRQNGSRVMHGEISKVNNSRSPISSNCISMILRVSLVKAGRVGAIGSLGAMGAIVIAGPLAIVGASRIVGPLEIYSRSETILVYRLDAITHHQCNRCGDLAEDYCNWPQVLMSDELRVSSGHQPESLLTTAVTLSSPTLFNLLFDLPSPCRG